MGLAEEIGEGNGLGDGEGLGEGNGLGDGEGLGEGDGEGEGEGLGEGVGVAVAVIEMDASAWAPKNLESERFFILAETRRVCVLFDRGYRYTVNVFDVQLYTYSVSPSPSTRLLV